MDLVRPQRKKRNQGRRKDFTFNCSLTGLAFVLLDTMKFKPLSPSASGA
jgi:hypothetical protein